MPWCRTIVKFATDNAVDEKFPEGERAEIKTDYYVIDANFKFATEILQIIKTTPPFNSSNFAISSLGLRNACAALRIGADGESINELQRIFHFPREDLLLISACRQILSTILDSNTNTYNTNFGLISSSRIIINKDFTPIKEPFASICETTFKVQVQPVDFSNVKNAVKEINEWIFMETRGNIETIVDEVYIFVESLKSGTALKLIILNGLYLRAPWSLFDAFSKDLTQKADFYLNDTDKIQVDMMEHSYNFHYAFFPELDAQVVMLRFQGAGMFFYVPQSRTGLHKILNGVESQSLRPCEFWTRRWRPDGGVTLKIPQFKIETTLDFTEMLKKLGMKKIFRPKTAGGDFKKMSTQSSKLKLCVNKVVQKVYLDVSETGVGRDIHSYVYSAEKMPCELIPDLDPSKTLKVIADRPFYFQICLFPSDLIVVAGVCRNPILNSST